MQPAANGVPAVPLDPANAQKYADATVQHVSVKDVEYTNPDLQAISPGSRRRIHAAARFQFNNLDIRNAVEESCIQVVAGTDPEAAAEAAQSVIDERL